MCGLSFYGSPWTLPISGKPCGDWAFQLKDTPAGIGVKFAAIPKGVDVLVTHMMPLGKLDELPVAATSDAGEAAAVAAAVAAAAAAAVAEGEARRRASRSLLRRR